MKEETCVANEDKSAAQAMDGSRDSVAAGIVALYEELSQESQAVFYRMLKMIVADDAFFEMLKALVGQRRLSSVGELAAFMDRWAAPSGGEETGRGRPRHGGRREVYPISGPMDQGPEMGGRTHGDRSWRSGGIQL